MYDAGILSPDGKSIMSHFPALIEGCADRSALSYALIRTTPALAKRYLMRTELALAMHAAQIQVRMLHWIALTLALAKRDLARTQLALAMHAALFQVHLMQWTGKCA